MAALLKKKEFWGTLIALGILIFLVKDIRSEDISRLYERINGYYLIPALLMQAAMVVLKSTRWRTIIKKTKIISLRRIIPLFAAGQLLNIIMPALTGQVGRLLLFARKVKLRKTYIFSTFVIEILFDAISLLVMIVLLSMAFVFPAEYRSISYGIAIFTVSAFVSLYLILTFKNQLGKLGRRTLRHRWPGVYITLKKFSLSFTKGISLLRSTQDFFRTLLFSFLAWTSQILVVFFLFKAFGFELPVVAAIVIMVINTLALLIPITPGNAGTFELAVMAPLLAFKISKADAVLYALALHITDLLPIMIMGLFYFYSERMTIREFKEQGEKEEIMEHATDEKILVKEDEL
jgi:uncharacterized protein (TIRG00374 family)